jgi:hypothetical protein
MTHANFPFISNFPKLVGTDGSSPAIDTACKTVETEWSGIFELYQTIANGAAKQQLLEGYLVGWWLADMYPSAVTGISGDGGMPLTGKSIGGVSISRKDLEAQPSLKQLESNAFGVKALMMIMSAPERFLLHGQIQSLSTGNYGGFPGSGR